MSSTVVPAVIAGVVSLLVSVASALTTLRAQAARLRGEAENTMRAQEARLRTELRTEFMAEEAIRSLLLHEDWMLRSFGAIKRRVRGFHDDELRRLLVRAGALAFQAEDGQELWGLKDRNRP